MQVKGIVTRVLPKQEGINQSNGQKWQSQDFVLEFYETPTDRYADRVLLRLWGEKVDELSLNVGDKLEVGFGHQVREYAGKQYNEMRTYKVHKVAIDAPGHSSTPEPKLSIPTTQVGQPYNESPATQKGEQANATNDLPFD